MLSVAVLGVVARAAHVHAATWEWSLSPSAASPKVQLDGRDYLRGAPETSRPRDLVAIGRTMGGGTILITGNRGPDAPTVIYVMSGTSLTSYVLSGGP
jgi:hypothetical protein